MYRIDYDNLNQAAEILYCFMTISSLTNPECTIWSDDGFPETVINDGTGFMTEQEFCEKITSMSFVTISCIASADKSDKQRVVLTLTPEVGYIVLNFSSATGKTSEAEIRLLKLLEAKYGF